MNGSACRIRPHSVAVFLDGIPSCFGASNTSFASERVFSLGSSRRACYGLKHSHGDRIVSQTN